MSRAADMLLAAAGSVVEHMAIPPRPQRTLPVPACYAGGSVAGWLVKMTCGAKELWRHQSLALEQVGRGKNVVVATSTASGKSLVFMTRIIDEMLNGSGKVVIFYPQKALGGDQLRRFEAALEAAGLNSNLVGEINGDVTEMARRDEVLERCRIILATPDVIHAWLMRQVMTPRVRKFLQELKLIVLDEAHVLEGVFGSNAAYLFRRLRSAQAEVLGAEDQLQWIAATATIQDPAGHLKQLTGREFLVIGEEENGAPFHGLTLMHINGPDRGAAAETLLADICSNVASQIAPQALIAFMDSRQGVEHVAKYIGREDVLPYRGGYEPADRRAIEDRLREGGLRGVIATSALELGIDIAQFEVGLNVGIPATRKALHQRIGRIGRSAPGAFAVIAPATAFAELGETFAEYLAADVEPSRLYLENRCIQVQAARCLLDERGGDPDALQPPSAVAWPAGFDKMFALARPGAIRPADLDQVLAIGADNPHHAFPLRAIRETEFALRTVRDASERIGTIDLEKALREAYPGATYYHNRRAFRVVQWRTTAYDHSIMVEPAKGRPITHALLTSAVSVSTQPSELLDDHLLTGDKGELAEILLRVADSVEGYAIGQTRNCYVDLRKSDWRMARKVREFATTGVLLRINQKWFSGSSRNAIKTRQAVADALAAVLARDHNINLTEIRTAHQKIAVYGQSGPRSVDDAIVIFDDVVGGLRLTSPLFSRFGEILDRLERATELAGTKAILSQATVARLRQWRSSLGALDAVIADPSPPDPPAPPGELVIFAPGSTVAVRFRGALQERRLVRPEFASVGDTKMLGYHYEGANDVTGWVPHDQLEPVGHDWRHALWNPESDVVRELAA